MNESLNWLLSSSVREFLFGFAFYYPLFMAWVWIIGGIWFYVHRERGALARVDVWASNNKSAPPCSILIPCMNEEDQIDQTVNYALASHYPKFEVIAIDDGSSDRTPAMLDELAEQHENLRVIHLAENQGKAVALRAGALAARCNYLVCIDGDALLHPYAVQWLMSHLAAGGRVGAVTGNPRILNRSSLLGRIQVGEFSSIIGLIKRAQRTYGRIFTVSGVIAGFNRAALQRIDYWRDDMVTDDIDISWRLQLDHWDIRYEPRALCYIYMPETLGGLWKQRLRWAQGGVEVLLRYGGSLLHWKQRRFWGIGLEYLVSLIWAYCMLLILILFFIGLTIQLPPAWRVSSMLPEWNGALLGATCLTQFLVSLYIDRRYEHERFMRVYFWVIWYPLIYWLLSMLTMIVAFPKTLFRKGRARARWISPDRGFRP